MDEICAYNKCTACAACVNICSHHAIQLKEDILGELHPVIDKNLCVDCGLCKLSCPNEQEIKMNIPIKCYAAWLTDNQKRSICASGGIGTAIGEYVITHRKGVVYGTAYDDHLNPITTYVDTIDGLESFKGSKYVQSIISNRTFREIKSFLLKGRCVLYIGTPCQIAGLKTFLKRDYDNLLTVDLICHGVCPSKYLQEEIEEICKKKRINKKTIVNIRFRGNDSYESSIWEKMTGNACGNNFALTLWNKDSYGNLKRVYAGDSCHNFYIAGFLKGVSLRENCYSCNYAKPTRVADITIGDFIGLGKKHPFPLLKKGHVSVVLLNTKKGNMFYKELLQVMPDICNVERDFTERLEYAPSLLYPYKRHSKNLLFRKMFPHVGYNKAIRCALNKEMYIERRKKMLDWYKKLPLRFFKRLFLK